MTFGAGTTRATRRFPVSTGDIVKAETIRITDSVSICRKDLTCRYSRSAGPGGQNVNKVNTRVTVFFDVANCDDFSDYQKRRILRCLATRSDSNGVVRVASQRHRTQARNRNAAVERLAELLTEALKQKPIRRKTKISNAAKQRRLEAKKRRSLLKQQRVGRSSANYDD